MVELFLILVGTGYLIYRVAFGVPKDIKRLEQKIDMLNLHIQEIELKLNQGDRKVDKE